MCVDPNVYRIIFVLTNYVLILITTEHSTKEQGGKYDENNRHDDSVAVGAVDAEWFGGRGDRRWGGARGVAVQARAAGFAVL